MKLCCLRLTTDLVLYMACTEKVHANYYSAQTEMLKIFSSINILSAKLLLTRHGDISAVLKKSVIRVVRLLTLRLALFNMT